MIIIVTQYNDLSTSNVIEYLLSSKIKILRKNEDVFSSTTLRISNSKESSTKDTIWQRRGGLNFNPKEIYKTETIDFLNSEQNSAEDSIEKIHRENNYLGGFYEEKHHEKIYDLYLAKSVGIKVPETLVTNEKTSLLAFFKEYKKIITKAIKNPFNYIDDEFIYSSGKTLLVNQNDIDNLDEYFAISKFQEYIEKELEIRIFFFDGSFFEMAIFSQVDPKTKVDYRSYNFEKPNRFVPFKLPKEIRAKLKKLLNIKKLNTCSIDLILTKSNEFVFLEINPQGQYSWLTNNCNYYIDKFIAEKIQNYEKNR